MSSEQPIITLKYVLLAAPRDNFDIACLGNSSTTCVSPGGRTVETVYCLGDSNSLEHCLLENTPCSNRQSN